MKPAELLNELYTTRWYLNTVINSLEKNTKMDFAELKSKLAEGNNQLTKVVDKIKDRKAFATSAPAPAPTAPAAAVAAPAAAITAGVVEMWYPKAVRPANIKLKSRGQYAKGYPQGAIVHFTAGRYEKGQQSALDTLSGASKAGYNFLTIATDGTVYQCCPLSEWGLHAGDSNWDGLGPSVSNKLVGIEICNAGMLQKRGGKYFSWFDKEIPAAEVREVNPARENQVKGFYHKYTPEQEAALIDVLVWLKKNNPGVFNVDYILGHDEVSGPAGIGYSRKQDPGGALSMTMSELRKMVKKRV